MTEDQREEAMEAPPLYLRHRQHRPHGQGRDKAPGGRSINFALDGDEYEDVAAAAARVGLRPTSYAAAVTVAVARNTTPPMPSISRDLLTELNHARTLVGKFGVNVNQAVAALNTTGDVPQWASDAVALCARVTEHLDEVVQQVQRKLP